ncbi:MAG TPA: CRISPR-associated endonuclease Cas3'', partial [Actinotalea sp.]|nr:CRISPR-associated endonuclease Cas3'' [Actinotalea sp.]
MSETDEAFASSPLSLSPAARSVWAKSWPQHAASIESWAPLWRHLLDSAACAGRLWDTWLPEAVRSRLASFAGGEASARALCVFAAGVHDIGKATPAFAVQVGALRDEMVDHGLEMPVEIPGIERRRAPHNLAGQVLLGDWLQRRFGWTRRETGGLASVVGAHHGVPPAAEEIVPFLARGGGGLPAASLALLGSQRWQEVQDEILDELVVYLGVGNLLDGKAWTRLPTLAWSLVLSLVVVADWLASNDELFPLTPVGGDRPLPQPDGDETSRIDAAFARLAFPRPWQPRPVDLDVGVLLAERFALPADTAARPVQSAALRAARDLATPGLLIIEAPMGEGKTEAALLAAETFAARVGSGGVFVALPTQATADAMFSRLMAWVSGLPATGAGVGLVPDGSATADPRSVYLAHGKTWLNPDLG